VNFTLVSVFVSFYNSATDSNRENTNEDASLCR